MASDICPRCQQLNACAIASEQPPASCWCMQQSPGEKPMITTLEQASCFCEKCLRELHQRQDQ